MSLKDLMAGLKEKANELKTEALKFKNKDFLQAAMAGSALLALADGEISPEEKRKMVKFIENYEPLSVFKTTDIIGAFGEFVSQLEFDNDLGEAKALEALGKMKNNSQAARLIMRLVISIGAADGDFDDHEKAMARRIAVELGLTAAEFEL
ncbi:MAG: TerB family tellurite resistance protein [Methyloprofundus sp.]|nr:TerB family tellurite resistance protein [Methyloprofundus sp.]MDT8425054.1 TerB family tellurite resistance protein [Methyloprofundus sp.]